MANLFDIEGPFVKYGTLLFDMVMLSVVWAVTSGLIPVMLLLSTGIFASIPLICTILIIYACVLHWLVATCSVMYALGKKQRGTDTYTLRDFGHAFKLNYKQCMILSLIITTMILLIVYNIWLIAYNKQSFGFSTYIVMPLELLLGLELIFVILYLPNLIARFDMKTKDFIKYSFLMANKHLLTTLILVVLFGGCVYLCAFVNLGLGIVLPGLYMYIAAALLERVFKNYMPSEDEELENEEVEGFSLDAERQAIIDQYLNQAKFDDQGVYRIVKVDDEGNEIVEEDNYHIVKVDEDGNAL